MRVTVRDSDSDSEEWKPGKCVDSKKEHCTFGTKGPAKVKGGERSPKSNLEKLEYKGDEEGRGRDAVPDHEDMRACSLE